MRDEGLAIQQRQRLVGAETAAGAAGKDSAQYQ